MKTVTADKELLEREKAKLQSRKARLKQQLTNPEVDPATVGEFNFTDGIWSLALMRDAAASKPFFEAAAEQFRRHIHKCPATFRDPQELYGCFNSHFGLFVSSVLAGGAAADHIESFDRAQELLAIGFDRWPPERGSETASTPLIIFACSVVALAALWRRTPGPALVDHCRRENVRKDSMKLKDSLVHVAEEPQPASCKEVAAIYRDLFPLGRYRAGLLNSFQIPQVHAVSAVAHEGDLMNGAIDMFA